jgi:putative transposase
MSRKGNCWDNAVTETLFGSLKVEQLHGERFATIRQAKDAVLAWLLWYNQTRMHSTLNYVSPVEFENRWTSDESCRLCLKATETGGANVEIDTADSHIHTATTTGELSL